MTTVRRYGATVVTVKEASVETLLPGGPICHAWPHHDAESHARATSLGYADVVAMTREHDPLHSLLCHALGLAESPSLRDAVNGRRSKLGQAEEEMVLAAQRFLNLSRAAAA